VRADDRDMGLLLGALNDGATMLAVRAERALLAALQGGCQVPIGALAVEGWNELTLHALVADLYGAHVVRGEEPLDPADPEGSGERLAARLRAQGGEEILRALRQVTATSAPQPE
jgi:hydroxymethylbilane synthase